MISTSDIAERVPVYIPNPRKACMLAWGLVFSLHVGWAHAFDFDVVKIDKGEGMTREPAISSNGVVVWHTRERDQNGIRSDIILYRNGKEINLTRQHPHRDAENIKPQVYENNVAWVSSFHEPRRGRETWKMKNPPTTEGAPPEKDAADRATSAPVGKGDRPSDNQIVWLSGKADTNAVQSVAKENSVVTNVTRHPSGNNEICIWDQKDGFERITIDQRNDIGVAVGPDGLLAWQKAKGFPFGWEVMVYQGGQRWQITTNDYYDMAPRIDGVLVTWYGWDGADYEVFLYDHELRTIEQISSNRVDDVSPIISGDTVVWEGYPAVEADIYLWSRSVGGSPKVISDNREDDINPRIHGDYVVWQGFDGDDFEIWVYEISTGKRRKLTRNAFDDVQPEIHNGLITWMGYFDNWDAEIYVADLTQGLDNIQIQQLTDNEVEDRDPKTAAHRVVWQAHEIDATPIYLAIPKGSVQP